MDYIFLLTNNDYSVFTGTFCGTIKQGDGMSHLKKLYKKAKESPTNLNFSALLALAEMVGFEERNQNGSHKIYKHREIAGGHMNFQPDKHDHSKAKLTQIKQLVKFIDENKLIDG